jgi:putative membrane protein
MKHTVFRCALLAAVMFCTVSLLTFRAELADDFMGDVARGNIAEIALSQLAADRAQNEAVKQFAQMMVTDHSAAATELQTLATSKSYTLPTAMDQKHQSALTKLQGRSGADFDREYMKQMVSDHEKMVSILQKQADKGTDADQKAFAAKMLPIVHGHLTSARTLADTVGAGGHSNALNTSTDNTNRSTNSNRRTNSNHSNGNSNGNSNRP